MEHIRRRPRRTLGPRRNAYVIEDTTTTARRTERLTHDDTDPMPGTSKSAGMDHAVLYVCDGMSVTQWQESAGLKPKSA